MPTTPFTVTQTEQIREVVGIGTQVGELDDLSARLFALNDAQAAACIADAAAYGRIAYSTVKSRGGIKGTDFDIDRDRLLITNRVRLRLNYPRISGGLDKNEIGVGVLRATSWAGAPIGSEDA